MTGDEGRARPARRESAFGRRGRLAITILRESGWGGLARRTLAFLARRYRYRGGWERQYRRAERWLRPQPADVDAARGRLARVAEPPRLVLLLREAHGREALARTLRSLEAAGYPRWELLLDPEDEAAREAGAGEDGRGRLLETARWTEAARGGAVAWIEGGDTVEPAAFELAAAELAQAGTDLVYGDEDARDRSGRPRAPFLKPGWSPETLLAFPYVGRPAFVPTGERTSGWDPGAPAAEYDLLLRAAEGMRAAVRIPRVLYHRELRAPHAPDVNPLAPLLPPAEPARRALERALVRRGVEGRVEDGILEGTFRVRPSLAGAGKVDVVIPTHNEGGRLRVCLESIEANTSYPRRCVTVVDHASDEPESRRLLASLAHPVRRVEGEFNFARLANEGAAAGDGEFILFLNNDTRVAPGWLEALLEAALLPGVGVAGGKLLYPRGEVQHGGILMGVGLVAAHAHKYFPGDHPGYMGGLAVLRNYAAVDGACFLVRRELFEDLGGFDESLGWHFQDADFCLRAAERGWRTVFTPYCRAIHEEEATGLRPVRPAEAALMRERWGAVLDDDPFYHPAFTRRWENFTIDWPERMPRRG